MTSASYRTALDAAVKEYERLGEERRAIDRRLAELAQTIGTLSRLLGQVPTVPLGLTEACRLILRSGTPLTPVEVRDRLRGIGMDLSVYSNDLSAIHTVLKRLNNAGNVRLIRQPTGKSAYLWHAPVMSVPISAETAEHIRQGGTFHAAPPSRRRAKP